MSMAPFSQPPDGPKMPECLHLCAAALAEVREDNRFLQDDHKVDEAAFAAGVIILYLGCLAPPRPLHFNPLSPHHHLVQAISTLADEMV